MAKTHKISTFALIFSLLGLILTTASSCRKEKFISDSSAKLEFSTDTIIFDTVFTTVGSVTQYLKVYNRHKGTIRISNIYLESGAGSNYRINVDGTPGKEFTDVEIGPQDSMFIFVEVTVDPNSATTPLIVSDKLMFETNGNSQSVDLVAWGQDAYFFKPAAGSNAFIMPCDVVLAADKPIVFYGYAIVDENCDLTFPAGADVHFHPGSGIIVYKGSLFANGTATNKVTFQGDRLEFDYREVPGQWDGIRFVEPQNCTLEHAVIKNGFYGLWVDTTYSSTNAVTIKKTEIANMASLGIYGNAGANITGENCLVKNCGLYGLALTYGGSYNFSFCTFGNYWSESTVRNTPNFYMKNWFETSTGDNIRDFSLSMKNCIIYGNITNEYEADLKPGAILNYTFTDCLIKTEADLSDGTHFIEVQKNVDPLFEDPSTGKLKLLGSSSCIGVATVIASISDDIDDKPRDASPDIGCYEF